MQKNLLPGDPRPIDLKSTLAILVCHTWFQRDQIDGGFRRSSQHPRNQLNWKVRPQNMLLNRVTNHDLELDERRATGVSRLLGEYLRHLELTQHLALLRMRNAPIHIAIPGVSQPRTDMLLPREIRHHGVCELQLDLPVKRI